MAYPPSYREVAPPLPSIKIHAGDRFSTHPDMPFGRSSAMPIPGIEPRHHVPPALPPPTEPFSDLQRERRGYSSNYGSANSLYPDQRPSLKRRDTGSTTGDEGYASYASTDRSRESFPTEFGALHAHNTFSFKSAADSHCDSMKAKLDCARPPDRSPPRSLLSSMPHRDYRLAPPVSLPVQLPIHSRERGLSDSRESSFSNYRHHDRSPKDGSEFDYSSPRTRSRRNTGDETNSVHGTYDYHTTDEMEMEETSSLKRLHIDETHSAAGHKRRAPSPPDEYAAHGPGGLAEAMRRREGAVRSSPTPRLATIPQGSSLSSTSAAPGGRTNSYLSTLSIPPSQSSVNAYSHRSPGGISSNGVSPTSSNSPYAPTMSLNPSPRGSISRASGHNRAASGSSPRKVAEPGKSTVTKLQGFWMCECCPKKPKKFDSADDLAAHEAEKQYECNYCGNRFKNKNEAERHQNSLHVRRHSWSCSALSGYDRAFHESTNRPGEADVCGYCGDEFARTGVTPGTGALSGGILPKRPTDQDWDERIRHLQEVHKFRECNSSKKFYRADHFRQHLKHSHAGTSGKWTNMLENACLMDEDPAQPGSRN
ncbi:Zinc finger, C2H2-type/integrase, DNA-binding protein [Akanthomyces lecanii RCEF 1005]|uniref:Zinc finger, C2H2-type/integrase, DNA-binding protein n=1 Tax=Akanthomyces lecanii RCEF 1005 TaxID=1081108 RepID=A0A168C941_CORDF|nr:Zinc finger, C2H2-type/integrase, DNA-binding protein [Akanthomyces lecanii RCEF 1005]